MNCKMVSWKVTGTFNNKWLNKGDRGNTYLTYLTHVYRLPQSMERLERIEILEFSDSTVALIRISCRFLSAADESHFAG